MWLPKTSRYSINSCLPAKHYVICRFDFPSYIYQRWCSNMMKLQDLIVLARSLYGGPNPSLGFVVLSFVGVVFFPNPSLVGVVLFPSPAP